MCKHGKRGQTFPEMMIVVAIIAILAAVIMANLFHARATAQVSATMSTEQQIVNAVEMYYNDYGVYPGASFTKITPALFGGNGNKYYNGNPTASDAFVRSQGATYYIFMGPASSGCWTADPCTFSIAMDLCIFDGSNIPSNITDVLTDTPPVNGAKYVILLDEKLGFHVAGVGWGC